MSTTSDATVTTGADSAQGHRYLLRNAIAIAVGYLLILAVTVDNIYYVKKHILDVNRFHPFHVLPYLMVTGTLLICIATKKLSPIAKSLHVALFFIVNDLAITLFAPGTYDSGSRAFLIFFQMIAFIPAFLILSFSVLRDKQSSDRKKTIALFCLPVVFIAFQLVMASFQ